MVVESPQSAATVATTESISSDSESSVCTPACRSNGITASAKDDGSKAKQLASRTKVKRGACQIDDCVIEVPSRRSSPVPPPGHDDSLSKGNSHDERWEEILPSDSDDAMEYDAQNKSACSTQGDSPSAAASMQTAQPVNTAVRRSGAQTKPVVHTLNGNSKKQLPSRLPTFFVTPNQLHRSSYFSAEEMQQANASLTCDCNSPALTGSYQSGGR